MNKSPGVSKSSIGVIGDVSRLGAGDEAGCEATGAIEGGAAGEGIVFVETFVEFIGTPKIAARSTVLNPGTLSDSGVQGSP